MRLRWAVALVMVACAPRAVRSDAPAPATLDAGLPEEDEAARALSQALETQREAPEQAVAALRAVAERYPESEAGRRALVLVYRALTGDHPYAPPKGSRLSSDAGAAPTLELPRYQSATPFSLAQERGHVVVLDVWATWCEPCRRALPAYQALEARYVDRGLRVFALDVDPALAQVTELPPFLKATGVTLPVLLDADGRQAQAVLGTDSLPTAYVFDRAGALRFVESGFDEERLRQLEVRLRLLLAE